LSASFRAASFYSGVSSFTSSALASSYLGYSASAAFFFLSFFFFFFAASAEDVGTVVDGCSFFSSCLDYS